MLTSEEKQISAKRTGLITFLVTSLIPLYLTFGFVFDFPAYFRASSFLTEHSPFSPLEHIFAYEFFFLMLSWVGFTLPSTAVSMIVRKKVNAKKFKLIYFTPLFAFIFTLIVFVVPGYIYAGATMPRGPGLGVLKVVFFLMGAVIVVVFNIIAGVLIAAIISRKMQRMVIGTGAVTIIFFALLNRFERTNEVRGNLEGMENWFYLSIIVASLMLVSLIISLFNQRKWSVSLSINNVLIILASISIVIPMFHFIIAHPVVNAPLTSFLFGETSQVTKVFPTIGFAGVIIAAIIALCGAFWLGHKENNFLKEPVGKQGLQQ